MRFDFIYAIPSYDRAHNQKTVNYLHNAGVPQEQICVFVQTPKDEALYTESVGRMATIIYRTATRGVEARNNILAELAKEHNVLMLDDDIKSIGVLQSGWVEKIKTSGEMNDMFSQCFSVCKKKKAAFWGVYPIYNEYFMEYSISTRTNINTVFGFCKGFNGMYDLSYDTKEDAALCAFEMSKGKRVLRFNFLAVDADHRKNKNGYIDAWHQEENIRCTDKLVRQFPTVYAKQKNKPWEVRCVLKDAKIKVTQGAKL